MNSLTINKLLEDFTLLTLEDKEYVLDTIRKQFIESKRDAIAKRAKEASNALKKGLIKSGDIKDLLKDLESA